MVKIAKESPQALPPKTSLPYIHRDLSWLSFNYRVLQEAKDPAVPLLERLKFLAIYSSNAELYIDDEFTGDETPTRPAV